MVPNCQPVATIKKEEKESEKVKEGIKHSIPSSMIVLSEKEKSELKDVLLNISLVSIGILEEHENSGDVEH